VPVCDVYSLWRCLSLVACASWAGGPHRALHALPQRHSDLPGRGAPVPRARLPAPLQRMFPRLTNRTALAAPEDARAIEGQPLLAQAVDYLVCLQVRGNSDYSDCSDNSDLTLGCSG